MYRYQATKLYFQSRTRAGWGRIRGMLTGRSRRLLTLGEITSGRTHHLRHCRDVQMVPIDRIRGTEDRGRDFDCDFNPLHNESHERWLNVAMARAQERSLPPVELLQVGDIYFVRDGHHRISVARALGQLDIEAEVTVLQVTEPLPQAPAPASGRLIWQSG